MLRFLYQGLLAERDVMEEQKASVMADLLIVAAEANACGPFKLKILDPSHCILQAKKLCFLGQLLLE